MEMISAGGAEDSEPQGEIHPIRSSSTGGASAETLQALKERQTDTTDGMEREGGTEIETPPMDSSAPTQYEALGINPPKSTSSSVQGRNSGIHPRNVYATEEPNFAALAAKDAELRPYVVLNDTQRGALDFTDPDACRSVIFVFKLTLMVSRV